MKSATCTSPTANLKSCAGFRFLLSSGEIVSILGSNGAGKTSMLRSLAGLIRPAAGSVQFAGRDIGGLPAYDIANLGLALVPEGRQLFPEHTVRENLELGAYRALRNGKRAEFAKNLRDVFDLFPRLRERIEQPAGSLSGGEQQMVAIARALVASPRLLLLDEPSLGLAPIVLRTIFDAFTQLKARGLTILIVEQMAWLGLEICDRAHVLETGKITISGTSEELTANPRVMEAYLGASI